MTKHNWQEIYSAGEQLNKYPYDFIVSSYFRLRSTFPEDKQIKVLDLGCGAGNHALFCAENGADVLAVDYSDAALAVVRLRAAERGLKDQIHTQQIDFENFELEESGFDLVIDRLAVRHVARGYAATVYDRVFELLDDKGFVFSNLFSTGHRHKDYGEYDNDKQIWHSFNGGIFESLKTACFYTEEEVRQLLRRYTLQSLVRETETETLVAANIKQMEIWKIIAQKTV